MVHARREFMQLWSQSGGCGLCRKRGTAGILCASCMLHGTCQEAISARRDIVPLTFNSMFRSGTRVTLVGPVYSRAELTRMDG